MTSIRLPSVHKESTKTASDNKQQYCCSCPMNGILLVTSLSRCYGLTASRLNDAPGLKIAASRCIPTVPRSGFLLLPLASAQSLRVSVFEAQAELEYQVLK